MQGLYDYVIKPLGDRYNNSVKVGDKNLILNTEVFNHQHVNRQAIVLSTPKAVKTEIKAGDIIITHHNVFRRWHDVKGVERNSRSFYKEDKYFIKHDQIFAYKIANKWRSLKGYCFVKPIKSIDKFSENNERPLVGIVKYTDGSFDVGDLVGFRPSSEYEFVIDGERLYRVFSNFITIKYEYQGDEEEYNPSWA